VCFRRHATCLAFTALLQSLQQIHPGLQSWQFVALDPTDPLGVNAGTCTPSPTGPTCSSGSFHFRRLRGLHDLGEAPPISVTFQKLDLQQYTVTVRGRAHRPVPVRAGSFLWEAVQRALSPTELAAVRINAASHSDSISKHSYAIPDAELLVHKHTLHPVLVALLGALSTTLPAHCCPGIPAPTGDDDAAGNAHTSLRAIM
jgi:hypothetical protein